MTRLSEKALSLLRVVPRYIAAAWMLFAYIVVLSVTTDAADSRVIAACRGDYLAFCSEHDPDGMGVRRCMDKVGPRLSKPCLNALIAAGAISQQEAARRLRNAK